MGKMEVDPSDHDGQADYERAIGALKRLALDVRKTNSPFLIERNDRPDGTFDVLVSVRPPTVVNKPVAPQVAPQGTSVSDGSEKVATPKTDDGKKAAAGK